MMIIKTIKAVTFSLYVSWCCTYRHLALSVVLLFSFRLRFLLETFFLNNSCSMAGKTIADLQQGMLEYHDLELEK